MARKSNQSRCCAAPTPLLHNVRTLPKLKITNRGGREAWDFCSLACRRSCIIVVVPSLPIVFPSSLFSACNIQHHHILFAPPAAAVARHELLCLGHPVQPSLQHMRRRHPARSSADRSTAWAGRGGQTQWRDNMGAAGTQRVHRPATHNVYCVPIAGMLVDDRHNPAHERCDHNHAEHQATEGWQH